MLTEEQIWNYLDGKLSAADRKDVEQSKAADEQAAALFQEILMLHDALKSETLLAPSLSFTDKVMASLTVSPVYAPVAKFSYKPLLLFVLPSLLSVVGLVALLVYSNVQLSFSLPVNIPVPQLKHPMLYFVVADILLFGFFIDQWAQRNRPGWA